MTEAKRRANIEQAERQRVRPVQVHERVRALLSFPFSPWIREATIGNLLADDETREETIEQLGI